MPLINFKTNLTTLRYGLDRPGGGDSGQPYIQAPIEGPNTPGLFDRYYEANRTGLDFPVRGGAISQLIGGSYAIASATIDRIRIEKFFKDAPRGKTFIQKQVGLQLANPRTQVQNTLQFVGLNIGNAYLPVTQTYNPLNTLAQVQVQGTGAHFNRQGAIPTIYEAPQTTYEYIVRESNTAEANRLTILQALKLTNTGGFGLGTEDVSSIGLELTAIERMGISTNRFQLFNYQGGPGSVYGIGTTIIRRATDTTTVSQVYSKIALNYSQLAQQNTYLSPGSPLTAVVQDFREQLVDDQGNTVVPVGNYFKYSQENRLNVGNPGTNDFKRVEYNQIIGKAIDEVNRINPFYYDAAAVDPWTEAKAKNQYPDDMIKFAFECMSNDQPGNATALIFRAFLDGSISDAHSAAYNEFKYLGRGETFRTYQGFDRTVGFSFKIYTQTRSEMRPLYKKLNHLISQVYPDYSPKYNIMRGNVVRLTIGDYLYRTPGFLENVNVTIDNSNTPWEIVLNQYNDDDVRQLPQVISVSCTFRPIMDLLPRRENKDNQFVPLIVNKDRYLDPAAETTTDQKALLGIPKETSVTAANQVPLPTRNVAATGGNTGAPPIPPYIAAPVPKAPFTPLFPTRTTQPTTFLGDQLITRTGAGNNRFLFLSNP